jgi:hypothetical protein
MGSAEFEGIPREMARVIPQATLLGSHSPITGAVFRRASQGRQGSSIGERISREEADRSTRANQGRSPLFEVDDSTIIDAGVRGNSARDINHSCSPICEAVNDGGRIFIESRREIRPGEELSYDYRLETEEPITPSLKATFGCNCGARRCRGTLLNVSSVARASPESPTNDGH